MASTLDDRIDELRNAAQESDTDMQQRGDFGDLLPSAQRLGLPFRTALGWLASLKLTVVLFALAIAVVLAGTFAQARMPLDDAIGTFFRIQPRDLFVSGFPWILPQALFVWVPLNTFLVSAFGFIDPPLPDSIGFPLPKGWTIGLVMMLNLFAAHLVRFRLQADGLRLGMGLGVMGLSALLTAVIVFSSSGTGEFQETPFISYAVLWTLIEVGMASAILGMLYAAIRGKNLSRPDRSLLLGGALLTGGVLAWSLMGGRNTVIEDAYMRILYQLLKGTLVGVLLLGGAWLAFGKRAGIVVIHLGVGLLMVSEVFVGLRAVESQMMIGEGQSANYLMDIHNVELAVIQRNHPDYPGEELVTIIPQSRLIKGALVQDERLPFDIKVHDYFENSTFVEPHDGNLATRGLGVRNPLAPIDRFVGTDTEGVDTPAAYVELLRKEADSDEPASLGTWLVSPVFDRPLPLDLYPILGHHVQQVVVDPDTTVEISLRYARTYLPFEVHLYDVETEHYIGTSVARRYESLVRVTNPEDGFLQDNIRIWMNHPMRYAGYTFYQQGYGADPESQREYTILQVVSNHGWLIPYLSCMIVGVGLTWQFSTALRRFLERRRRELAIRGMSPIDLDRQLTRNERRRLSRQDIDGASSLTSFPLLSSLFPWMMALAAVVYVGSVMDQARLHRPASGRFDVELFGRLPVVEGGRIKPLDSFARNVLMAVSEVQTFQIPDPQNRERELRRPAIEWLLEVAAETSTSRTARVFRIENEDLLHALGLESRSGLRYGLSEFDRRIRDIAEEHDQARRMADDKRAVPTAYQRALVEFGNRLLAFQRLESAFSFPQLSPRPGEDPVESVIRLRESVASTAARTIPVQSPGTSLVDWRPFSVFPADLALKQFFESLGQAPPMLQTAGGLDSEYYQLMEEALDAYSRGDVQKFNNAVVQMHQLCREMGIADLDMTKVHFEAFYNGAAPFLHAWFLSIAAFVLLLLSWLGWSEPLRRSAFWIGMVSFLLITFAMVARIYISGRPPVTNLYSSAVFIAWAGVLFGLVFEMIFRNSMGIAVAALAGMGTLKVAHALAADGDTFTVLQAVLDTQFWLATHVVTITLGYATTYVAGLFGLMFILAGVFSHGLTDQLRKSLVRMMYGSLCFALLFSFIGTVLGGLWADDSWGRFWGWDPKENGALIIVLWNALVLHARWDRLIRDRGLAALCVLGNIAVSWSWFGTNALGIGLHAYGFKKGTLFWLGIFVMSQLIIAGLAMLPPHLWRSRLSTSSSTETA